ncbi:MAG: hypothetical protein IKJ65_03390 [Clostridia bacterium]|nr:hypothetical protein [Clostridia bacterium]
MKKLIALLLLLVFAVTSAVAEEPFDFGESYHGDTQIIGMLYTYESSGEGIPIAFTKEAKNVVISHASGISLSLETVKAGDVVVVYSDIPEGLPNLSVSYSLPEDEEGIVHIRMISKSGIDGSYIIMNDWYTEMAWKVAKRLCSIASDEGLLSMYSSSYEILEFNKNIGQLLPESMPENHYFVSTAWFDEVFATYLEREGVQMKPENLQYYLRSLPAMIKSSVVSQEGALSLAASAVLQASECMVLPDIPFEPGFIVFDTGDGRVIVVSISLAGEGIVSFNASTVGRAALEMLTDMETLMEEMGM